MIQEAFQRRFDELVEQLNTIPIKSDGNIEPGAGEGCLISILNLLQAVYGKESEYYENFSFIYKKFQASPYSPYLDRMRSIFLGAKENFEGGYVFNVDLRVSGEVFGDFVVLAKQSLAEEHTNVAAVLASAALEDALKRYALNQGLDVNDKTMQEVVNALKGSGHISGAQKSLVDAMPRIRNMAMHAQWDKISEPEVNSIIGFVEQFLLSKFS